jgi:hypothetical protein
MKLTRVARMFVLISLLGGSALIYAQDQQNDAKPPQEEPRPEATKPAHDEAAPPRQEEMKPPKQDDVKPPKQDDAKPPRDESKPENREDAKPSKQAEQALVINKTTVVNGQPRFQYSGYWFTIVDPWPVGWAYTDQCYIDYIDGQYFLFDLLHPGVQIAITVVL